MLQTSKYSKAEIALSKKECYQQVLEALDDFESWERGHIEGSNRTFYNNTPFSYIDNKHINTVDIIPVEYFFEITNEDVAAETNMWCVVGMKSEMEQVVVAHFPTLKQGVYELGLRVVLPANRAKYIKKYNLWKEK